MAKRRSKGNVVLRTVLLAMIGVILGLSFYSWNVKSLVGNKLPMPFGYGVSVVLSGSMEPELSVDDLVCIKKCPSYQKGDVVVYQSGNVLIIHRVVEIHADTAITQGDANNIADEPIPLTAIKGKMVFSIPGAGIIVRWLKSPVGVLILLAAIVLMLNLSWRREKEMDNRELEKIKEEIRKLKSEKNL